MARGRMINKKISNSGAVNGLPEPAQLLYTWLIPHLDCNGCFYGGPQMIKSLVFPRKNYSRTRIENWLKLMENSRGTEKLPLIVRYFVDGEQYLFMPGFIGEQIGLRREKGKPDFPPFNGKNTEIIGQNRLRRGREVEVEVEVEVEEGEGGGEVEPTPSPTVEDIFKILEIKFPYSFGKEPTNRERTQLRDLAVELYNAGGATEQQIHEAFSEACNHNKHYISYVRTILLAWLGIKKN